MSDGLRGAAMFRAVIALTLSVAACAGATLTDAQVLWCMEHDMTAIHGIAGDNDDIVLQAAAKLGIPIPATIAKANDIFIGQNLFGISEDVNNLPDGFRDDLDAWRKTPDYARACSAAFDSR